MLASVSCVLKEEMAPHLDAITPRMMESLTSEEGVKVSPPLPFFLLFFLFSPESHEFEIRLLELN